MAADQLDGTDRSDVRIKVFLSADVTWGDEASSIRVRNISRWGLSADSANPPSLGVKVRFRRGTVERLARVMWLKDKRFGLRFEQPMSAEDELQIHFPSETPNAVPTPAPPFSWKLRG